MSLKFVRLTSAQCSDLRFSSTQIAVLKFRIVRVIPAKGNERVIRITEITISVIDSIPTKLTKAFGFLVTTWYGTKAVTSTELSREVVGLCIAQRHKEVRHVAEIGFHVIGTIGIKALFETFQCFVAERVDIQVERTELGRRVVRTDTARGPELCYKLFTTGYNDLTIFVFRKRAAFTGFTFFSVLDGSYGLAIASNLESGLGLVGLGGAVRTIFTIGTLVSFVTLLTSLAIFTIIYSSYSLATANDIKTGLVFIGLDRATRTVFSIVTLGTFVALGALVAILTIDPNPAVTSATEHLRGILHVYERTFNIFFALRKRLKFLDRVNRSVLTHIGHLGNFVATRNHKHDASDKTRCNKYAFSHREFLFIHKECNDFVTKCIFF